MTDYPLVSAIMLAGKTHLLEIRQSIECFKKQTYPYKELIIVNNAKNHFEATSLLIKAQKDVFMIDTPFNLSAGMARNYGISAANGQILAQFDPNFWHFPNRLESQIATLAANEAHISILSETFHHSFISGRSSYYKNDKNAILNTMVFLRPSGIDYPNSEKQEELGILDKMQKSGMKIISMKTPELACKILSGDNVKSVNHGLTREHYSTIKRMIKAKIRQI